MARNKFFKNKNCNKVSLITDINGIPLSVLLDCGNVHDLHFVEKHIKDLYLLQNKKNTLIGDKGYVSKKLKDTLINNNYNLVYPLKKNMKGTNEIDKNIYKKRIHIEHTFQKLTLKVRLGELLALILVVQMHN